MKALVVDREQEGSLGWYCARTLSNMGHDVVTFDLERRPPPNAIAKRRLRTYAVRRFPSLARRVILHQNRRLVESVREAKPDLLLVIKGRLVLSQTLEEIHRIPGRPVIVNWYPDPLLDLNSHDVLPAIGKYDHLFFKERNIIRHLKKLGFENVQYLPHCTDAEIHHRIELTEELTAEYGCDIAIAGDMYPFRVAFLERLAGLDLKIYGFGWDRLDRSHSLRARWHGGSVYGRKLTQALNAARIVLNVHIYGECFGVNQRTFHTAGCGAFQLTDARPDLEEFFEPGRDIIVYRTAGELEALIKDFLPKDRERNEIGLNAMKKVHARHTFLHRMKELLDMAGLAS
ncbi:glycosyltransferase [Acidobacteriota bacterium]